MASVIGLGEILWDIFPDRKVLGGAPANFAYHSAMLGHSSAVLSRVGRDELGEEIVKALMSLGMDVSMLSHDDNYPTGTASVQVDDNGKSVFTINERVAWDHLETSDSWIQAARNADVICFGSLAQRSRSSCRAITRVLDEALKAAAVFDVNLRQHFYSKDVVERSFEKCNILKLNEEELPVVNSLLGRSDSERELAEFIMEGYDVEIVCMTMGARGCRLYSLDETVECPAKKVMVSDTVGSGDAFTAALVTKYLEGASLDAMGRAGNLMGGFVATQKGATPAVPRDVICEVLAIE